MLEGLLPEEVTCLVNEIETTSAELARVDTAVVSTLVSESGNGQ